jgi:galactitol-specific phosphotransferase system IIC component
MDKIQKLELMDKIQRELDDLQNSQTAILKKVSQIAAHNISINVDLLDKKLPDLEENISACVGIAAEISESFGVYREKFFTENKLAAVIDPTA